MVLVLFLVRVLVRVFLALGAGVEAEAEIEVDAWLSTGTDAAVVDVDGLTAMIGTGLLVMRLVVELTV